MTDYENAEKLYLEYKTRPRRKNIKNVCLARPNWNGCDFCDVYGPYTGECWKQNATHKCVYVKELVILENGNYTEKIHNMDAGQVWDAWKNNLLNIGQVATWQERHNTFFNHTGEIINE
jgi:hypothetical protein